MKLVIKSRALRRIRTTQKFLFVHLIMSQIKSHSKARFSKRFFAPPKLKASWSPWRCIHHAISVPNPIPFYFAILMEFKMAKTVFVRRQCLELEHLIKLEKVLLGYVLAVGSTPDSSPLFVVRHPAGHLSHSLKASTRLPLSKSLSERDDPFQALHDNFNP